MTEDRLKEIEALAALATPGPWKSISYGSGTEYVHMRHASAKDGPAILGPDQSDQDGHVGAHMNLYNVPAFRALTGETEEALIQEKRMNARFIANARQDVPDLVAEVRRLQGALESAKAHADAASDSNNCRGADLEAAENLLLERARQAEELEGKIEQLCRMREAAHEALDHAGVKPVYSTISDPNAHRLLAKRIGWLVEQRDDARALLDELLPLAVQACENLDDDLDQKPMRHSLGRLVAGLKHTLGLCGKDGCHHHKPSVELYRARREVVEAAMNENLPRIRAATAALKKLEAPR